MTPSAHFHHAVGHAGFDQNGQAVYDKSLVVEGGVGRCTLAAYDPVVQVPAGSLMKEFIDEKLQ